MGREACGGSVLSGCRARTGAHTKPPRTLTFTGGARGPLSLEPQATAKRRPQPAQLALHIPPGTLSLSELLLQPVDLAAGLVQASPQPLHRPTGLLQPPGRGAKLGPESVLGTLALAETCLQPLLLGLRSSLYLRQPLLQPQDLWEGCEAIPESPAIAALPPGLSS